MSFEAWSGFKCCFQGDRKNSHSRASRGADVAQLQEEIKARTSMECEQILSELHIGGFKVKVPVKQILALKADLCIPWTKLREVRR